MAVKLEDFFVTLGVRPDSRLGGTLRKLSEFFKALPGFTIAGIGAKRAIDSMTGDIAQLGDRIAKTARSFGISGEELQRLEFAAERSGVGVEALRMALSALPKRIDMASQGAAEATNAFDALGMNYRTLLGLSPEEQFKRVADAIGRIEDPSKRTNVALRLFEESGARLIPLFVQGSKGINALGDELENLGGLIDEDTLRSAEEYEDIMTNLGRVVRGLLVKGFKLLAPLIKSVVQNFIAFRRDGVEGLSQSLQNIAKTFKAAAIAGGLLAAALGIQAVAAFVAADFAVLNAIAGLALWIDKVIIAAAPVLALAAVIGLAIFAWDEFLTTLKGGDSIVNRAAEFFRQLMEEGTALGAVIGWLGNEIFGGFGDHLGQAYLWILDMIDGIKSLAKTVQGSKIWQLLSPLNPFSDSDSTSTSQGAQALGFGGSASAPTPAFGGGGVSINNQTSINVPPGSDPQQLERIKETIRAENERAAAALEAALTP